MKLVQLTRIVAALVMAIASASSMAQTFVTDDFHTYADSDWGNAVSPAGVLIAQRYDAVYSSTGGFIEIGSASSGFSIAFTAKNKLLDYLPDNNPAGVLTSYYTDPAFTSSGKFGSLLVALRLNIDFADAGFLTGSHGVNFGDLVIGPDQSGLPPLGAAQTISSSFYGLTIRQFAKLADEVLGGALPFSADYIQTTGRLNDSFVDGVVSATAQRQLSISNVTSGVPEPASWALMFVGFAFAGSTMRGRRALRLM